MMPASIKRELSIANTSVTNSSAYKSNKPFDISDKDEHKNSNVQSMLLMKLRRVFDLLQLFLIVARLILRHQQQATSLLLPSSSSFLLLHLLSKEKKKKKDITIATANEKKKSHLMLANREFHWHNAD